MSLVNQWITILHGDIVGGDPTPTLGNGYYFPNHGSEIQFYRVTVDSDTQVLRCQIRGDWGRYRSLWEGTFEGEEIDDNTIEGWVTLPHDLNSRVGDRHDGRIRIARVYTPLKPSGRIQISDPVEFSFPSGGLTFQGKNGEDDVVILNHQGVWHGDG